MKRLAIFSLLAFVVSCGGTQKADETSQFPAIDPASLDIDGNARLTTDVVPTSYDLDLTIDPTKERFQGRVSIDVQVAKETRVIKLHAQKLEITRATVETGGEAKGASGATGATMPKQLPGDSTMEPEVVEGENGGIALIMPKPVQGAVRLGFEYSGPLDEVPTSLYRVEVDGDWYAYTQFEPLEARKAFPCFDEPKFKTPYTTKIRVPENMMAASNSPGEATTEGGMNVYDFAETKPLPTYLVAFAVGDFDVTEAPAGAIEGVPFRILTTKGKGKLTSYMLERTPQILSMLTEYFGSEYPYAKLDVVAVPNFSAGAMENVGLVTFRETLLLLDPDTASIRSRRAATSVMAHELAHMWFGNLVTLPWWDELWLNESFATWMAHKVLMKIAPELEPEIDAVSSKGWVMGVDSLTKARAIRQPIEHGGDVYNAFDGITYGKGAAILRMFEAWVGEEELREGVRAYLGANAHSIGTTEDLMRHLADATGEDVGETMRMFLDQPGTPMLDMEVSCGGDRPVLQVKQTRYLPAGSKAPHGEPWQVPICVKFRAGKTQTHCALVDSTDAAIELPTKRCPTWVYPNAGEVGYYRWNLPEDELMELVKRRRRHLSTAEKVGLFSNVEALLEAEKIDAEFYLETLSEMSEENHRTIVRRVVSGLYFIDEVVGEEQRKAFQKRVKRMLRSHLRRVGRVPKDGEPPEHSMLRPRLIKAMAYLAEDDETIENARETTKAFLKKMDEVRADLARTSLPIAAYYGKSGLWLSYKMALNNAPNPAARSALLHGLGNFGDPSLVEKSLGFFLDGTVRAQDFWSIVGPTMDEDETFAVTWDWFTANYDQIVQILGEKSAPRLPGVGRGFCSQEGRKKVEAFFSDESRQQPGTARNLANTLEQIDQCIRTREYVRDGVAEYLK